VRTLLLLLALLVPCPRPYAQDETLDFQRAAALRSKADYASAAAAFDAWLERYPQSARVPEVLVQCGITHLEAARARQMLNRNPPDALEHASRALAQLQRVLSGFEHSPHAARAQYVISNVHLSLGDLHAALDAAEQGLGKYGKDAKYAPKALLRRAELRHHLLEPELALADYRRWKAENPRPATDSEAGKVELSLEYLPRLGRLAPPLEVVAVQGAPPRLEELRSKVVALLFFDVECQSCPKELPFLRELERRYGARGLVFIALANRMKGAPAAAVAEYAKKHALSWPVALDAGQTFRAYAAELSPNLVLVDRNGFARWHEHPSQLADWTVERLLEEPAVRAETGPAK